MRCVDKTQVSHGRSLPVFPYAAPAARHAWRAAWTLEYACDASFKRGAGVTTPSGCQAVRGSGSTRQSTTSLFGRCSACGKGAAAVRPDTGCAGALGALHSAALGATRTDCSPFPMVLHSDLASQQKTVRSLWQPAEQLGVRGLPGQAGMAGSVGCASHPPRSASGASPSNTHHVVTPTHSRGRAPFLSKSTPVTAIRRRAHPSRSEPG